MSKRTIEKTIDLFKIYADKTRLEIIHLLINEELCVHQIVEQLEVTQSAISHALKQLRDSDVVNYRKDGKHVYYSLKDNHIKDIFLTAYKHCDEC